MKQTTAEESKGDNQPVEDTPMNEDWEQNDGGDNDGDDGWDQQDEGDDDPWPEGDDDGWGDVGDS